MSPVTVAHSSSCVTRCGAGAGCGRAVPLNDPGGGAGRGLLAGACHQVRTPPPPSRRPEVKGRLT